MCRKELDMYSEAMSFHGLSGTASKGNYNGVWPGGTCMCGCRMFADEVYMDMCLSHESMHV